MDDKMKITGLMEELMYLIDKNIGTSIQPKADPEAWRAENRKKQAAGVKFECRSSLLPSGWGVGHFEFYGKKENYREVQEATKPTIPPHADKRALYWSQRAAGTNEVWQCIRPDGSVLDIGAILEPCWLPNCKYLVKPKRVTYYFVLAKYKSTFVSFANDSKEDLIQMLKEDSYTIIGDIETREVEL